jgi:2-methylisocitrate lyase-like PEP mutase family enzyme
LPSNKRKQLIIYVYSGAATTASRLGQPDLAIATLNDFVQSAQMVCSLDPHMPVIADADTGLANWL